MNLAVRLLLVVALIAVTPTVLAILLVGGVTLVDVIRERVSRRRMRLQLSDLLREDHR